MLRAFLDHIRAQHADGLPFVAFRLPREGQVTALLQEDDKLHYLTDFTQRGFVFAPFDATSETILLKSDRRLIATIDREVSLSKGSSQLSTDDTGKKRYVQLVADAVATIRNSTLEKVVLSRRVAVPCETSPVDIFQRLLGSYENAFCYLWYHPKIGTWLGATPEILLSSENQRLTTMSLAGTRTNDGSLFDWGTKELEEQELVTRYIASALEDKVADLHISDRETIQAGNLLHLRTKLVARYEKGTLGQIVHALHPTPAVCGLPLDVSKDFILEKEGYPRAYYTGYLGELNARIEKPRSSRKTNTENQVYRTVKTRSVFFVNLRCMQLHDDKAFVYVGGGITKDSNPDAEWEETVAKTHTMLRVLNSD